MVYEKYKSFWDSEVANFECSLCGKNLFDFPELIIDGKSYCFSCSKKRFSDLSIAADRENRIIDKNYEDLRAIYNRSKNNLQEEHYRYDKKKKEFVNSRINDNRIDLGSYLNAVGGLRGRELMIAVFLFWTGLILPVSIYLFLFLKPIRAIK